MTEIIDMFSSLLSDFDLTQITDLFTSLIEYITNLLSSLM